MSQDAVDLIESFSDCCHRKVKDHNDTRVRQIGHVVADANVDWLCLKDGAENVVSEYEQPEEHQIIEGEEKE